MQVKVHQIPCGKNPSSTYIICSRFRVTHFIFTSFFGRGNPHAYTSHPANPHNPKLTVLFKFHCLTIINSRPPPSASPFAAAGRSGANPARATGRPAADPANAWRWWWPAPRQLQRSVVAWRLGPQSPHDREQRGHDGDCGRCRERGLVLDVAEHRHAVLGPERPAQAAVLPAVRQAQVLGQPHDQGLRWLWVRLRLPRRSQVDPQRRTAQQIRWEFVDGESCRRNGQVVHGIWISMGYRLLSDGFSQGKGNLN